ncbi:type II toxin-antitoxin system VapC family toxin [Thauera aromatica]|nr:type II toxin-antitoxin system VapC family toxin [Thauera aromatica]MCK2127208.1 type II toxin-antitoxin system VapC family toxin [Thauera aromatica]
MPSVDTNVLARYLVRDDPEQYRQAVACVQGALAAGERIHLTRTVILELEWVLRSRYRFDKTTVLTTLRALLEARNVSFEAEGAVEYACYLYEHGAADFADALHLACCSAEQALPFLTFDDKAARLAGARRVAATS